MSFLKFRSFLQFWGKCWWKALKAAASRSAMVAYFVGLGIGASPRFIPSAEWIKGMMVWGIPLEVSIPLAFFIMTLALGLLVAPHSIYMEVENQRKDLQAKLDEKNLKRAIREAIANFLKEGQHFSRSYAKRQPPSIEQVHDWIEQTDSYLRTNLDESYAVRLRGHQGITLPTTSILFWSTEERKVWQIVQFRLIWLNDFLAQLS